MLRKMMRSELHLVTQQEQSTERKSEVPGADVAGDDVRVEHDSAAAAGLSLRIQQSAPAGLAHFLLQLLQLSTTQSPSC